MTKEHKLYSRRLTDKILICVHTACDQQNTNLAIELLAVLDNLIKAPSYSDEERRKLSASTVGAHERIWALRHKEEQEVS